MGDFNAGSIEGTLDLDNRPFEAGLRKAIMQADNFSKKKVKATADLDTAEVTAKKAKVDTKLTELDHKKVTPKADLDISEAEAKALTLHKMLMAAYDAGGLGKSAISPGFTISKYTAIAGGLMSIAAAAAPATAAVIGFGSAAGFAFAGAGLSLGLFAKVAEGDFAKIQKAAKAGLQLSGPAGVAEKALEHLQKAWSNLQKSAGNTGFKFLTIAFNGLASILPKLAPLLHVVGVGMDGLVKHVMALAHTTVFAQFLATLEHFMHGFLAGAGPLLVALLTTFMHMFIALQPLMAMLGNGILYIAKAAERLSGNLMHGGITPFVEYLHTWLPKLGALVMNLYSAFRALGAGIAPLIGPAFAFINTLLGSIGKVNLAPFAKGFGDVLVAVRPLLPILAQLLNVFLKPFGALLSALAHGPIAALTHSLRSELQPAFGYLGNILHTLVKPLAQFIASIANLANPTGVKLFTALLKQLDGIVHTLAPAFSKLAVALENVIDNGIETLLPLLPGLGHALKIVAEGAALVANGLGKILAHRTASDVLLGTVAAVWLGVKAFKAYAVVMKSVELLQAAYATAMLGSAAATQAGGLSLAIYVARLIAVKTAQIAMAVSTAVLTGVINAAKIAWAALTLVMELNPFILIATAIIALGVALVVAYEKSKTFRNIVNAAFTAVADVAKSVFDWLKNAVTFVIDFIKAHWQYLPVIFLGPMGLVVGYVISHFTQIKDFIVNALTTAVHFVSSSISNVVNFFQSLPGRIVSFAGAMLNAGVTLMTNIWHGLQNVWASVWSWVSSLPAKILNAFTGIGGQIVGSIKSSIGGMLGGLGKVGGAIGHALGLASGGVTTGLTHAIIGDNPGGREAVVPLDKYDLPRKGDSTRIAMAVEEAAQARADRSNNLQLDIIAHLKALHEAVTSLLGKGDKIAIDDPSLKRLQQMLRTT